jgi:hypothetical protein
VKTPRNFGIQGHAPWFQMFDVFRACSKMTVFSRQIKLCVHALKRVNMLSLVRFFVKEQRNEQSLTSSQVYAQISQQANT